MEVMIMSRQRIESGGREILKAQLAVFPLPDGNICDIVKINTAAIPAHISDRLSSALDVALQDFYSSPENVAAFEAWLSRWNTSDFT